MARRLVWSPEAIDDLSSIAAYIERDSPWYARVVVAKLVETAEAALVFPEAARVVPELADPLIRERFAYTYRVIYRIFDDRILVLTVVHGSRLLEDAMPKGHH